MSSLWLRSVNETARFLERHGVREPAVGMILGSGFGRFADHLDDIVLRIPYSRIPNFPVSTVKDHAGNLVFGRVGGHPILVMQGRIHCYEGYTPAQVTFPTRVMKQVGAHTLVVTNAAGGINPIFEVGDLMLILDHLNMMGIPLHTAIEKYRLESGAYYTSKLHALVVSEACRRSITLRQGVLASMLGPSFETPAEIAMLRRFGADAVTMSTIPEVVVASHIGMQVMGFSCISNKCAGEVETPIRHEDVMAVVDTAAGRFSTLMSHVLKRIA